MKKHTPLPWRLEQKETTYKLGDTGHTITYPIPVIEGAGGVVDTIARMGMVGAGADVMQANAEFIFRACHTHYDLLEALEGILGALYEQLTQDGLDNPDIMESMKTAALAIVKAKGV